MKDGVIIEMNILIVKMNKIMVNVEAMKAFNQWRLSREESPGYDEVDFFEQIEKLEEIIKEMEKFREEGVYDQAVEAICKKD